MTRQEKIDKIYEVIADKTLSFGCKVKFLMKWQLPNEDSSWYNEEMIYASMYEGLGMISEDGDTYELDTNEDWHLFPKYLCDFEAWEVQSIWHPVMIWDVMDRVENNVSFVIYWNNPNMVTYDQDLSEIYENFEESYEYKREPIENQAEECIDYVLSLIEEKWQWQKQD